MLNEKVVKPNVDENWIQLEQIKQMIWLCWSSHSPHLHCESLRPEWEYVSSGECPLFFCYEHFQSFRFQWRITTEWTKQTCNNIQSTGSWERIFWIPTMESVEINYNTRVFMLLRIIQRQMFNTTIFSPNRWKNMKCDNLRQSMRFYKCFN